MNLRSVLNTCALAALGIALAALSGPQAAAQRSPEMLPEPAQDMGLAAQQAVPGGPQFWDQGAVAVAKGLRGPEEDAGWLGVELQEVTPEAVKEQKLPGEYGVVLREVVPDSPAAKAGLKANDVVTELGGQRVEGAAQFRRMIREIPPGRTVQLTVWRDGKAQTISAVLGTNERNYRVEMHRTPGPAEPGDGFYFPMPKMPPMAMPDMPDGHGQFFLGFPFGPRLGIDAEDLAGQLGNYFGAPGGEGVLVREVTAGSPAEKAGLKAGDVIIKLDGERVRTAGELRERLAQKHEQKTVALGVLRNRSEISVTVEPEQPPEPKLPRALLDQNVSI